MTEKQVFWVYNNKNNVKGEYNFALKIKLKNKLCTLNYQNLCAITRQTLKSMSQLLHTNCLPVLINAI